ncbi:MAG: molybdopterin-dependent oxidoreductase [Treponema sp.]|nr:molybdopterin-dependent oxidoreductase [Treponema sp.]
MLYGLTIRSPIARGSLKSIECPKLPSSYSLITPEDIPGKNFLPSLSPEDSPVPVLAGHALSYIGEPVAILLGPDRIKLDEYAVRIKVQAEEETPVFSSRKAPPEMILGERSFASGSMEEIFAKGKTIVNGIYRTGIQEHWYPEPVGAAAECSKEKAGRKKNAGEGPLFTIHTGSQWPFHVRRSVALVLGISENQIAVECTRIALSLDGKLWFPSLAACHAALGAFVTGKPVKILYTREEDFRYSPKRNESEIEIRSALGEEGEILGTEIGATINLGAQGIFTGEILDQSSLGVLGNSRLSGLRLVSRAVRTNIPPQGPFAGFGMAQGFFAMELHVSRIADTLRQDPAEWRKKHQPHGFLPSGVPLKEKPLLNELIDAAAGISGYYRKWASYELLRQNRRSRRLQENGESLRGIGIATAWQGNGLLYSGGGACGVELTLEKDGSLEIRTSMVSSGDYFDRIWGDIASEILAIEREKVKILVRNTAGSPDSGPGTLSRNITTLTKLVEHCCLAIRKQRFRNPLPITVRRQARPVKSKSSGERYVDSLSGRDLNLASLSRPGWGAAVVEVEIYPASFTPVIRGLWLGIDGGKILSESGARSSLKTAVTQALGWASRERLGYEEGIISKGDIDGYDIPSPGEIPPIRIDFLPNDGADPKGIGDIPFNCVPAAYVQAVSQAMDHRFGKIPLLPEDIWKAGRPRKEEKPV